MMRIRVANATLMLGASLLLVGATGPLHAQGAGAAPGGKAAAEPSLDAIRSATERFRDVKVALAEGYVPDPTGMCVTAAMEGMPAQLGGMGIHYFRPDLLGITAVEPRVNGTGTHTDFLQPSILVYEPQPDGSLELVAVENLVFRDAWHAAGHAAPPVFKGNEWYTMVNNPLTEVDEAHGFEPHYELHLWLYRDNPNGLYAQFNPTVSCAHAGHGAHGGGPRH
jgi:hypothetical protein